METIVHELESPFKYAHKGEELTASFIELRPPTTKNLNECSILKQAVFQSLRSAGKGEEVRELSEEDKKAAAEESFGSDEIMMILNSSSEVELSVVLATARELFTGKHGVALVDGEERFTKPLFDEMSFEDLENMTGAYLANFILASSLKSMKNL